MKILGCGGIFFRHDPAAAVLIDGKVVAAAEEERFVREKHAPGRDCSRSIEFCLKEAGINPGEIDAVAFPWSFETFNKKKWPYAANTFFSEPSRAFKAVLKSGAENREVKERALAMLKNSGIKVAPEKIFFVEHHIAHAASAYMLSGYKEAAIMTIDGNGEFVSTLFARGSGGVITKIKEIDLPDSLGMFYSTMTAYLGFNPYDGEYKLMGMAPYGDPSKADMSGIISYDDRTFKINPEYIWPTYSRRYRPGSMVSKKLVDRFGPPREGDGLNEPYVHIAAATQKIFEDIVIRLMENYLGDELERTGNLVLAGGCALNVSLNRKLLKHPLVRNIFVQPASHDAGAPLGAAAYISNDLGDDVKAMESVYLGPSYTEGEIESALKNSALSYKRSKNIEEEAAELLSGGKVIGWFQGRSEFGPRALGNRSILANPAMAGASNRINETVKFREKWRPFCPSIMEDYAEEIIGIKRAPFMTFSCEVMEPWRDRIREAVHVDASARPQTVKREDNPRFYELLKNFYRKTGIPVLINTSLNRRGEAMALSPDDAIKVYTGSGLDCLAIGDFLLAKKAAS